MIKQKVIKAIADDNRLKIIEILLQYSYCVRALSKELGITESATSQHIKVLREAELLIGEKRKHHIHYYVNRETLHQLAQYIESLSNIDRAISDNFEETVISKCSGHNEHGKCNCHFGKEE